MSNENYSHSLRTRLRVLFSPIRLTVFLASVVWLVTLNVIYVSNLGQPEWAGPASVLPIITWVIWMFITDWRHRNATKTSHSVHLHK